MFVCVYCYDYPNVDTYDYDRLTVGTCAVCTRNGTVAPATFVEAPIPPRVRHLVDCAKDMAILGELCECPQDDTVILCPECESVQADDQSAKRDTLEDSFCDSCGGTFPLLGEYVFHTLKPVC